MKTWQVGGGECRGQTQRKPVQWTLKRDDQHQNEGFFMTTQRAEEDGQRRQGKTQSLIRGGGERGS